MVITDHGAFLLVNVYVPNAGDRPARPRLDYKLRFLAALRRKVDGLAAAGREVRGLLAAWRHRRGGVCGLAAGWLARAGVRMPSRPACVLTLPRARGAKPPTPLMTTPQLGP